MSILFGTYLLFQPKAVPILHWAEGPYTFPIRGSLGLRPKDPLSSILGLPKMTHPKEAPPKEAPPKDERFALTPEELGPD